MSDTTPDTSGGASDRSKYIRTYAKDVATLTGTPAEPAKKPPEPAPEPVAPAPKTEPPPPKPSPWDMPEATRETAELYAAPAEEERSKVLERLRNKLKQSAAINVESPNPEPAPETPPPPAFEPPPPPPPPLPPVPPKEEKPSPLHTYTSDFAEHIDQKKASTFSVLAAQTDTPAKTKSVAGKRKAVSTALAVALIAGGVAGVGGAWWYVMKLSATPLSPLPVPSLVFADERMELSGSGSELLGQLADAANEPLVQGNVLVTYLSESTTTERGTIEKTPLAGGALIRALELPAPDILLRNVSPASTVGIISAGTETRPFFVFRVTSYERTFAGMLAWETTLGRDLERLYPTYGPLPINAEAETINLGAPTTTASSEPAQPLSYFTDAVVASRDVRVLYDTAGNSILLYGYADKATLILARDEAAFAALIQRLSAGTTAAN